MNFTITNAGKDDADFIAEGIMEAVGSEICHNLAGGFIPGAGTVKGLFSRIASEDFSQYSYRNALIAKDENGERAGVIVAYDGADLHELREAFVKEYNRMCGTDYKESDYDDETDEGEIYIDTLAVRPEYRNHGLGTKLIYEVKSRSAHMKKPIGLLVDPDNPNARKLYEKIGFKWIGNRKFAGVDMHHMQM